MADDSEINQVVMKHFVAKLGATAHIANNGNEAIEMLAKGSFHLIFMDVEMAGMGGLEATRFIRNEMHQAEVVS